MKFKVVLQNANRIQEPGEKKENSEILLPSQSDSSV